MNMLLGVISDTHGVLPPSVGDAFAGVQRIIHAGDIGAPWVLRRLEDIAPVVAVKGNMDSGDLPRRLQDRALVREGGCRILVVHDLARALRKGLPADISLVVDGHTHRAVVEQLRGVLRVNPGSAGGRSRDGRGPTAALVDCSACPPSARIIDL